MKKLKVFSVFSAITVMFAMPLSAKAQLSPMCSDLDLSGFTLIKPRAASFYSDAIVGNCQAIAPLKDGTLKTVVVPYVPKSNFVASRDVW